MEDPGMTLLAEPPPLLKRLRPLVIFGWSVAAVRLAMDFAAPDAAMAVGVYYALPLALAFIGWKDLWGPVKWTATAGTMVLVGLLVWGIPNSIVYTLGQFLEWTHGRFPALQDTAAAKVGAGLQMGGLTAVAGSVWCVIFGTLFIWLPSRVRRRKTTQS